MRFIHFFPYLSSKILEIYVKAGEAALPDAWLFFFCFVLFVYPRRLNASKTSEPPRKRFHVLGLGRI